MIFAFVTGGQTCALPICKARLDDDDLDRIEEALITADLGPAMAARIRERLAARRDAVAGGTEELRKIVADEIAAVLRPVAEPLEVDAFPRPQVILVIGVNGSGKTTTIAKLAHLFRSEEHTSELQSLMRISYAVCCLKKKTTQ